MPPPSPQTFHSQQLGAAREPGPAFAAMKRAKKLKIVKKVLRELKKQQTPGTKDWVVDPAKAYDFIRERVFANELPARSATFVVGFSTEGKFTTPGRLNGGYTHIWRDADGNLLSGIVLINPALGRKGQEKWLIRVLLHECCHVAGSRDGIADWADHDKGFHSYRIRLEKTGKVTIPFAPLPEELREALQQRPPLMHDVQTNDEWVAWWTDQRAEE